MLVQGLCLSSLGMTSREDQDLSSKDLCPLTISTMLSAGAGRVVGKAAVTNVQIQDRHSECPGETKGSLGTIIPGADLRYTEGEEVSLCNLKERPGDLRAT